MRSAARVRPYHLRHQELGRSRYGGRHAVGMICRGVVVKVYEPDSAARRSKAASPGGYVCDVLVYDVDMRTVLREVPIAVNSGGVNDHEVWKPRAAELDLTQGELVVSREGSLGHVSAGHDMDGDHVLVAFMKNDLAQPVIIAQIPHPSNNRKPTSTDSPSYRYRRTLRGVQWGVTDGGDVAVDTTGATDGTVVAGGSEVTGVAGANGNVTVTMRAGQKLKVLANLASAPEAALLGETFLTDLQTSLTEISGLLAGFGLATPNTATFLGKITTSISTGEPYLSAHVELD